MKKEVLTSKTKYYIMSDREKKYREGKLKRMRRIKWKEPEFVILKAAKVKNNKKIMAYLLHYGSAS